MIEADRVAAWVWDGPGAGAALTRMALAPASLGYGLAMSLRHRLYDLGVWRTTRVPAWVVSVGNLRVGGTGKTPMTLWIAERLQARGHRVAIVARGYRKRVAGTVLVSRGDGPLVSAEDGGDEAVMLAHRFPGGIITAERRADAARYACTALGADTIVLDDGFQHRALARDVDIVLVPPGDDRARLLPAGPLREPRSALGRADAVVVVGPPGPRQAGVPFAATVVPEAAVQVTNGRWSTVPLAILRDRPVIAVTGVARPDRFRRTLESLGSRVLDHWSFGDHHRFSTGDEARIVDAAREHTVITTEKDLVKLSPAVAARVMALRVRMEVDPADALMAALAPVASRRE